MVYGVSSSVLAEEWLAEEAGQTVLPAEWHLPRQASGLSHAEHHGRLAPVRRPVAQLRTRQSSAESGCWLLCSPSVTMR